MKEERKTEIIEEVEKKEKKKNSNIYNISEKARIVFVEVDE